MSLNKHVNNMLIDEAFKKLFVSSLKRELDEREKEIIDSIKDKLNAYAETPMRLSLYNSLSRR
ncbi:MAG: hypothetical protein E7234_06500 [Lachnospiraceae bacterium]|nr:hypothetical protein [Lachnospiraceae bacterium]